ncbi:MAG: hypothetical protein NZM35_01065 [Chitinophagales bacterium]|nr:hypothetical protein [Chitinophagales bacterium]MDW8419823.1 hypothetical protein [Chitinophagales bacterium]
MNFTKTMLYTALLSLYACSGSKEGKVKFTHANGAVKIIVTGERSNILEPFETLISIDAYNQHKGEFRLQVYAEHLDSNSVKINWSDDENATLSFIQRDGSTRNISITASPAKFSLRELKE